MLQKSQEDWEPLEKLFVKHMVSRLMRCEQDVQQTGMFTQKCLLEMSEIEDVNKNFVKMVERCINTSFWTTGDLESNNTILLQDREWAYKHSIDYHPTVTINEFTYRGDISFVDLTEAICAAYEQRPDQCNLSDLWAEEDESADSFDVESIQAEEVRRRHERQRLKYAICVFLVLFIIFNCCLWVHLHRKMKRDANFEMNQQVHAAVHSYFALSANDNN